jgi:hypothetical protein
MAALLSRSGLGSVALAAAMSVAVLGPALAKTVDQMTCAAAIRQALTTGKYEKRTSFGVIPMFGFFPNDGGPNRCPRDSDQSWNVERTLDNPRCPVAYTCNPRMRLR